MDFVKFLYENKIEEDGEGGVVSSDGGGDSEGNTSDSTPGYNIPYAFAKKCGCKKGASCGCNKKLKEATYKQYKSDESFTNDKDRLNKTIKLLYSDMCKVEQMLRHASKLKNEVGMDNKHLLYGSKQRITKLKDKLEKVSELISNLYTEK
jgi:hypothetical protein